MTTNLTAAIGSYNPYERSVTVIASTPNPTQALLEDGTPILESLVGWDLERFSKNPVVLWGHQSDCPPIGKASDFEVMPDGGLKMKITLLHPGVSDLADQIAGSLQDDVIRAVSVGFVPGAATQGADGTWTRTNNELLELSFVSVPADPNAGTPELNPEAITEEDERRKAVSAAASALAKHRVTARAAKKAAEAKAAELAAEQTKTDTTEHQRFDVGGRLDRAKRTSIGGAYINARVSRIGVLRYHLPDGTVRRELRHPDEVFKADSLATLDSVPVIDIRDHTAILTPADYKRASVGHVKSVTFDAKYIECELVVQDEATLDAIDLGERAEISCGYVCKHDWTPGTFDGEPYDLIQRDIKYNHVALCPPNRGRAGPDVGLRLDNQTDARWGVASITHGDTIMKIVKIDGTDFEYGTDAHIAKLDSVSVASVTKAKTDAEAAAQVKLDAIAAEKTAETKRADEAQAKLDSTTVAFETFKADAAKAKALFGQEEEEKAKAARASIKSKLRLIAQVARFFGSDEEEEDGKEDEKMDALLDKSDRDLMLSVIAKAQPKFDATDKSDDYVRCRFDSTLEQAKDARSINGVAKAAFEVSRTLDMKDTSHLDAVVKARLASETASLSAHKLPAA